MGNRRDLANARLAKRLQLLGIPAMPPVSDSWEKVMPSVTLSPEPHFPKN